MQVLLMLTTAVLAPLLGLALLLWLAHLEDTLPRDVQRARRRPAPPPILAIPVRRPATQQVVTLPAQRAPATAEVSEPGAALAV